MCKQSKQSKQSEQSKRTDTMYESHPKYFISISGFAGIMFLVVGETQNDSILVGLISESSHFVKSTLVVGESQNDSIMVGLIFESPHFVKLTFGTGDSENNNNVNEETIDFGAHRQAHHRGPVAYRQGIGSSASAPSCPPHLEAGWRV